MGTNCPSLNGVKSLNMKLVRHISSKEVFQPLYELAKSSDEIPLKALASVTSELGSNTSNHQQELTNVASKSEELTAAKNAFVPGKKWGCCAVM